MADAFFYTAVAFGLALGLIALVSHTMAFAG